ncbi:ATP-binding protein [Streptomyces sp. NPDC004658]|uniref:ATP-binding protein n=1 Tax=Streptomyces sp. NPDC004658 TaxID=3154672 RepID=UPI0033AD5EDF
MVPEPACVRITLSPDDIERWPDTPVLRSAASAWCRSRAITVRFPAVDRAVPICRHLTRLWLDQQHLTDENIRHTILLVTTELATNAIVHTDSTVITTHLRRDRTRLRVQVRDQGIASAGKPHWHNASGFGRGLGIIAGSTRALGTHVADDGARTTWATVSLTDGQPLSRSGTTDTMPAQRNDTQWDTAHASQGPLGSATSAGCRGR